MHGAPLMFSPRSALALVLVASLPRLAHAEGPTPGFPEAVVHWVVQPGETCEAISTALYGAPTHTTLLSRYQRVDCGKLAEGTTLVVPAAVTTMPDARLKSINPNVQARPSGGGWGAITAGTPLFKNHSVNTLEKGRADIEFSDRTRVFLAENTLVVIYGTAAKTSVKKNAPPQAVELEAGEVKAGLAALRGEPMEIAIKGGGVVRASSREAVVQRAGARTTVAVFDGKAEVSAGGKSVDVPKNFGTRFVGEKPPDPPRPLPPAPIWIAGGAAPIELAPGGTTTLAASWQPVAKAKAYRFEIGRDPELRDLVAREEVPARVTSFRAEGIPAGSYYVAVRAIDDEDYLGIASAARSVAVLPLRLRGGAVREGVLEISPYGALAFEKAPPGVTLAIDDGPAVALPAALEPRAVIGKTLTIVSQGQRSTIAVRARPIGATFDAEHTTPGAARVTGTLSGIEELDLSALGLKVVVRGAAGATSSPVTLSGTNAFAATFAVARGPSTIEVTDGAGIVLGRAELGAPGEVAAAPVAPPAPIPAIGITAPVLTLSTLTDVPWLAPTAPDAVSVSVAGDRTHGTNTAQPTFRASGSLGPLSVDGSLTTQATDTTHGADDHAALGARVRTVRIGDAAFEHGLAFRALLPATASGPATRLEPSTSFGGVSGRATWLASAGARFHLDDDRARTPTPAGQVFVLAGATFDPVRRVRVYGVFDAHLADIDGTRARGGLSLGVEGGGTVFGGLGARLSPWSDAGGFVTVQLAFGLRVP